MAATTRPGLLDLPPEIILEIAEYCYDRFIFDKLNLSHNLAKQWKESRLNTPNRWYRQPSSHYVAMAMSCKTLWNILPRKLLRPIPREIIKITEQLYAISGSQGAEV